MAQYLPIVVLIILALALRSVEPRRIPKLLAPRRPSVAKDAPYECGIIPSREPPERFPVSFYVVAMLFIMFDIEIIFLYPYAVERGRRSGSIGFWAIIGFSAGVLPDFRVRGGQEADSTGVRSSGTAI
jgi:NADH-quinone oxidoreductase subunit A